MYRDYWQLQSRPFENDFSARSVFASAAWQAAELKLRYVIDSRLGAALLTGPSGVGKTLLTHVLQAGQSEAAGPFIRVGYPQFSQRELLSFLAEELCLENTPPLPADVGLDQYVRHIELSLLRHAGDGRHPVIVIDGADRIDDVLVLRALQQLLEIRDGDRRIVTMFLLGEATLIAKTRRVVTLAERIAVNCQLPPLSDEETAGYIQHRLQVAGASRPIFDAAAVRTAYELSGGLPMRINHLCELSLLVGFAEQATVITADHVSAVAAELVSIAA